MEYNNTVSTGNFGKPHIVGIEAAEEKYRAALEAFAIFSEIDHSGRILYVNQRFCDISGYSRSELVGNSYQLLHSGEHSENFITEILKTLRGKSVWHGELCCRAEDQSIFWVLTTLIPMMSPCNTTVEKYMCIQFDVTDKRDLLRRMDAMTKRDLLTDLPNGAEFSRIFSARANANNAAKLNSEYAVAILDIDDFKIINDIHGQYICDELLVQVARRLSIELQAEHTVARIGGDEFALLLCHSDHYLQEICTRILKTIQAPFWIGGAQLNICASMGIRLCPRNEHVDVDQALRHANIALYRAKSEDKNCWRIFDANEELKSKKNVQLRNEILSGLENNEFEVHFQPIVELATSSLVGFESLIRWQHPERGLLLPKDFLPVVENDFPILMIGEWMLARALEFSQRLFDRNLPHSVSVNIAALHLQHPSFVGVVKKLLERHSNLEQGALVIEITESAALTNLRTAINVILQCKQLGAKFSLDDFGTGFSSLTYLRRLPIDELKIDREFIKHILVDIEDQSIVRLVTQLSELFGLTIVAEGIETEEQSKILQELDCTRGQGFGIAEPMPGDIALEWAIDSVSNPKCWLVS
ncbi:putative signaling protein [Halioglobus japonicus]|nr:putative signaling protein [Halioglobus japonicus]